jgi:hypothetical protein
MGPTVAWRSAVAPTVAARPREVCRVIGEQDILLASNP